MSLRPARALPAWRVLAMTVLLAAAVPAGRTTVVAQSVGDAQVRAAFIFNFTKFVAWPVESSGALVIGVAGDADLAGSIAGMVSGRLVGGRPLEVRRLARGDDPAGCHVLYVGFTKAEDASELLRRTRGPVLTVGETTQFLRDGGVVRFYLRDRQVKFQINQKNAEAAGLKISSQLLALAAR